MTEETIDSVKSRAQRPAIMCLKIGTPNTINFPFVTNGKLMVLGFSILSHIRVGRYQSSDRKAAMVKF